ncbi:MAG: sialidase family protein, partial [Vicinamibacterales bacterium]
MRRTVWATMAALALLGLEERARVQESPVVTLSIPGRSSATPWVVADGDFVAVAWGATTKDEGKTDVFMAVSRDGGARFSAPVQVNAAPGDARLGGELPPRVSLRRRGPGRDPEITVLWTARGPSTSIKLATSSDGGRTFSSPRVLSKAAAGDRGWPALTVDNRGAAYAIWLDHRGLAAGQTDAPHVHDRTRDGFAMAQRSGLYFASTGSSGARPERELAKGVCYCCKTALAMSRKGTIYAAWRHVYPGNVRDIAFTSSADRGRTFTEPVRVSDDGWEINGCPDDGPSLAVDAVGTAHIVWPTVMAVDGALEGALFYASTRNGRTFTKRMRIPTRGSPKPSHPQIVVDSHGRLVVAWDEVIGGHRTVTAQSLHLPGEERTGGPSPDG